MRPPRLSWHQAQQQRIVLVVEPAGRIVLVGTDGLALGVEDRVAFFVDGRGLRLRELALAPTRRGARCPSSVTSVPAKPASSATGSVSSSAQSSTQSSARFFQRLMKPSSATRTFGIELRVFFVHD